MINSEHILDKIRAALRSERRLDLRHFPIHLSFTNDALLMEGELSSVAAKKLALECAAACTEVTAILDRLRVTPAEHMGDGEIRELVRNALLQELAFYELTIEEEVKGKTEQIRMPPTGSRGVIRISVQDGVVTLNGEIPSLAHKRLAGVLVWWVPGSRDVINGLAVDQPQTESEAETTDVVRMVLEKDPFVNAGQIRVFTEGSVVTLEGLVPTESEREMAEFDAWYVFGVDKVLNKIDVRA